MAYREISELPLVSGGNLRTGEPDSASVLHLNVVDWGAEGDEQLAFWAGEDAHPVNGGTKRLFRGRFNPDTFNDDSMTLQEAFDGFNMVREPSAPVHTFYDAANFPFDADIATGARFSDMAIFPYLNGVILELRALVTINNHQTTGKNHVGMLKSVNEGNSWTFVQEVLAPDGGNQGTPFGFCCTVDNVVWAHVGDATGGKRERSSVDGGSTWVDHGLVAEVDDTPGSPNATNMPVGRGFIWRHPTDSAQDKAIAFINNSREFTDWPNTMSIWWKLVSDLGNGQPWTERPFPVSICGPTAGGEWQGNRVVTRKGEYLIMNRWGTIGYGEINSPLLNALITDPYAGLSEGFGYKSIVAKRLAYTSLWENLDYFPFEDGALYRLSLGGQYLAGEVVDAVFGDDLTMVDDASDPRTLWRAKIRFGFVRFEFVEVGGGDLSLRGPGFTTFADKNARENACELRATNDAWAETDMREDWMVCLVGSGRTDRAVFFNRDNRLCMQYGAIQDVDRGEVGHVWKVIPAA